MVTSRHALAAVLGLLLVTGCSGEGNPAPNSGPEGATSAASQVQPRDQGPQKQAKGKAKPTAGGYQYLVAPGDTMVGVATRFRLCIRDITGANDRNLDIFAGQTLAIRRVTHFRLGSTACNATEVGPPSLPEYS